MMATQDHSCGVPRFTSAADVRTTVDCVRWRHATQQFSRSSTHVRRSHRVFGAAVHAGFGMAMTVNYDGVYTPFEMGARSGNMPE